VSKELFCKDCGINYTPTKQKLGPIYLCFECGENNEVEPKYTGNMIYDHKTGASLQINTDPKLTEYIIQSTKLRNKGSNLGNNLKVDSSMAKSTGLSKSAGERSRRSD